MSYGITATITSDYSDSEKLKRYFEKEEIDVVDIRYSNNVETDIRCGFDSFDRIKESVISLTASRSKIEKTGEDYFMS